MEKKMYFKNDYHKDLYNKFISKLNNEDRYYSTFAYVASAIGKEQIINALSDHRIDFEYLREVSDPWSNSESSMLEMAFQLFNGHNLYYKDDVEVFPVYPTVDSIFYSLDSDNTRIILTALSIKYQ